MLHILLFVVFGWLWHVNSLLDRHPWNDMCTAYAQKIFTNIDPTNGFYYKENCREKRRTTGKFECSVRATTLYRPRWTNFIPKTKPTKFCCTECGPDSSTNNHESECNECYSAYTNKTIDINSKTRKEITEFRYQSYPITNDTARSMLQQRWQQQRSKFDELNEQQKQEMEDKYKPKSNAVSLFVFNPCILMSFLLILVAWHAQ